MFTENCIINNKLTDKGIIVFFFQNYKGNVICNSNEAKKIFEYVYNKEMWKQKYWTDSFGKNDPPPDFYSDKFKLMMDVMEVVDDEKKKGVNSKTREKEMEKALKAQYELPDNIIIVTNAAPNKKTGIYHNYDYYLKHFNRVIDKHVNSIPLYQKNHPNYKTIFFIFDTSTAYFELKEPFNPNGKNEITQGHFCFFDRKFAEKLINKNIDYVIWFTPFKTYSYFDPQTRKELTKYEYPKVAVIDVNEINLDDLNTYDPKHMVSAERQE